MVPYAMAMVQKLGPFLAADDVSVSGLAMAQANASLLRQQWCECIGQDQVYYRRANGSHGWMCVQCHGITQAG